MKYFDKDVIYEKAVQPPHTAAQIPVNLTKETMEEHRQKVLQAMEQHQVDAVLVYGDREHGTNFSYLTGFEPRFEEAAVVLYRDGTCVLLLGNEMLGMNQHCRILSRAVHVPYFSLPNQPMVHEKTMKGLLEEAGIKKGMRIGAVGWKMFTSRLDQNEQLFDIPHFIIKALQQAVGENGKIESLGGMFLDPDHGVRIQMNANEIAHYEFGASLAADCVLSGMDQVAIGKTEMEIAQNLAACGQPVSVTTICATGERFTDAVVVPRDKKVKKGDRFSITMGLKGGLTSRAAYVAEKSQDLPKDVQDFLERVARPYYAAAATWYSSIGLDMTGGELYRLIEEVLPKEKFGWTLNPGHLTADEEWLSSPVYKDSAIKLKSGMMLQMDIIPAVPGYGRAGAEDGIVLADEKLREEIQQSYPDMWKRMQIRRGYMEQKLGISLKKEVLPLSGITGYYRPFLLNKEYVLKIKGDTG